MSSAGSKPHGIAQWLQLLKEELAPHPGRVNLLLRVLLSGSVVTVLSLAFGVPMLMLSLLVVLAATQSNLVITRLVGVVVFVAMTMAVGTTILLIKFTYNDPLLRIVVASVIFFGCMFLMRATKIGPLFWVVGLVSIFGQTFVDETSQAELVVRALLWLWVAMVYPALVSVLINAVMMPVEPRSQLKGEIRRQLQAVDAHLAHVLGAGDAPPPISPPAVQKGALTLQTLLKLTTMSDKDYRAAKARHLAIVATVSRLYYQASTLPQEPTSAEPEQLASLTRVRQTCQAFATAIATDTTFALPEPPSEELPPIDDTTIGAMQTALEAFADHEANPTPPPAPAEAAKKSLFVEDAFTNPVYVQFALKTLLGVMLTWTFYNAADWGGVHTVMLTIVIVAQSTAGASVRKAILRVLGAVIGSLLALFMMVFVIPHVDSVVGALGIILPVVALAFWFMSGSERISYVGMQLWVTFGLALFMGFGPTTNLTEIRDRIIGVLLGVVVAMLIQAGIWPESEGDSARGSLADLLGSIAELLRPVREGTAMAPSITVASQQVEVMEKLSRCEEKLARIALEPTGRESQQEELNLALQTVLAQARSISVAASAVQEALDAHQAHLSVDVRDAVLSIQEQAASALDRYADGLRDAHCQSPEPISLSTLDQSLAGSAVSIRNAAENLVHQLSSLPSWGEPSPTPTQLEVSHALA